jgi:hypothetical protein
MMPTDKRGPCNVHTERPGRAERPLGRCRNSRYATFIEKLPYVSILIYSEEFRDDIQSALMTNCGLFNMYRMICFLCINPLKSG